MSETLEEVDEGEDVEKCSECNEEMFRGDEAESVVLVFRFELMVVFVGELCRQREVRWFFHT